MRPARRPAKASASGRWHCCVPTAGLGGRPRHRAGRSCLRPQRPRRAAPVRAPALRCTSRPAPLHAHSPIARLCHKRPARPGLARGGAIARPGADRPRRRATALLPGLRAPHAAVRSGPRPAAIAPGARTPAPPAAPAPPAMPGLRAHWRATATRARWTGCPGPRRRG